MSFGFGVGDFLATSQLCYKAWLQLKDSTGSAADYQSLKLLRRDMGNMLNKVDAGLVVNTMQQSVKNAFKAEIARCMSLLQEFDELTKKYDASLSPGGSRNKFKDKKRKLEWAGLRGYLNDLFNRLDSYMDNIRLLLLLQTYQTVQVVEKKGLMQISPSQWGRFSPFSFTDIYDRQFYIPYELGYTFCTLLRTISNAITTDSMVLIHSLELVLYDQYGQVIKEDGELKPGMEISMSILQPSVIYAMENGDGNYCPACRATLTKLSEDLEQCPVPGCGARVQFDVLREEYLLTYSLDLRIAQRSLEACKAIRRWRLVNMKQYSRRMGMNFGIRGRDLEYYDLGRMMRRLNPQQDANQVISLSDLIQTLWNLLFGPRGAASSGPDGTF